VDVVPEGGSANGEPTPRPGLERALERLEAGEVSCLVVCGLEDLSPRVDELASVIDRLERAGARLVALDVGLDTASSTGRLALERRPVARAGQAIYATESPALPAPDEAPRELPAGAHADPFPAMESVEELPRADAVKELRPVEPVEEAVPPEPVEEPAAPEPVEETVPKPVEETAAPEPVEERAAPEPGAETAAPEPVEDRAAPESVDEPAASEPVDDPAAPQPVEERAAPEPVEEPPAPEPVEPEPVDEPPPAEPVEEPPAAQPVALARVATRALGYATLPAKAGGEQHELEAQVEAIEASCADLGIELVDIVRERQVEGRALDRPGLSLLIERIAARDATCVIVASLGRLSHSVAELGTIVNWLERNDIRLIAVDLNLDTASSGGRLTARALASVASWERDRLSERTRKGLAAARARRGASADAAAPGAGTGSWPRVSKRIAEMRADGMTLQAIADQLNAEGVPTPRGGAKWRPSSVQTAAGYKRRSRARQTHDLPTVKRPPGGSAPGNSR
jgi:DNA invertase Pin-like site-specific DNA recombinase